MGTQFDVDIVEGFRHEALIYSGRSEFLDATVPFVRAAMARREPILIVVPSAKVDALEAAVGPSDGVLFADMERVGRNPAQIIGFWSDFAQRHGTPGERIRGIGEPIWAERSPAELVEGQRH